MGLTPSIRIPGLRRSWALVSRAGSEPATRSAPSCSLRLVARAAPCSYLVKNFLELPGTARGRETKVEVGPRDPVPASVSGPGAYLPPAPGSVSPGLRPALQPLGGRGVHLGDACFPEEELVPWRPAAGGPSTPGSGSQPGLPCRCRPCAPGRMRSCAPRGPLRPHLPSGWPATGLQQLFRVLGKGSLATGASFRCLSPSLSLYACELIASQVGSLKPGS